MAGFHFEDMDTAWPSTWPKRAEELHIFDPSGDVLLILERRSVMALADYIDEGKIGDCAPKWKDEAYSATEDPTAEEPLSNEPLSAEPAAEGYLSEDPISGEPLAQHSPAQALAPDWPEPDPSTEYDSKVETEAEAELENDPTKTRSSASSVSSASEIQKVQMRVSSKHLILASATFHIYLSSDKFSEGQTLQKEGNLAVPLPDEDPDAMIILLHIIHGQTRKVPRQVSLEMLSRLAFVVNHRQIHEAVEHFSDIWIEHLKKDLLPDRRIPEALSWLFIFWVFQKEDGFRDMSQVIEQESDNNLEDEADAGLPIPTSIIRKIQQKRLNAIESAIQVIHDLITKYSVPEIICLREDRFTCDAALLGSLVKGAAVIGISPRPESPYPGIKFKTLAEQIQGMQILDRCRNTRGYGPSHNHGIKDTIDATMKSLEDGMCGLNLESYLPEKTRAMRS